MIRVSKKKFLERLDVLPTAVREAAFSPDTGGIISAIGKTYHLDEQRIGTLIAATGAVFFGFLHRTDLVKEILEETRVDTKIAQSIADEIEQKVFARIRVDLDRIFEPVSTEEVETETPPAPSPVEKRSSIQPSKFHPAETREEKLFTAPKGEGPLILHEEKGAAAEAQKGFKGFSMPLSFLRSKMAPNAAPKAAARVEMPPTTAPPPRKDESPFAQLRKDEPPSARLRKDEPRVVHYNENRTPLSPFGQNEEFINLETFEKFSPPSPGYGRAGPPSPGYGRAGPPSPGYGRAGPPSPGYGRAGPPSPGYGKASPLPAVSIKPSVEETPPPSPIPAPPIQPAPPAPAAEPTPRIITEPAPKIVPEPQTPAPAKNPVPPPATEGGEPKLKGNTVDLR